LSALAPGNATQTLSPDLLPLPVASVKDGFRTRWYRSRSFVAGIVILGVIIGMCTFAPLLTPYSPTQQDLTHVLQPPSAQHLLGTDQLGIDVWSQLLYGGRTDLRIAFLAVILPFILGTTLGCLAGYYGRAVDVGVMRMVDIVVAFPFYVLVIALVFAIGPGEKGIYIAITIVGWVSYARIVRGEILVAKQQDYVLAARSAGFGAPRIIVRHLLPNVITQAIVFATADVVLDILAIVTLGYLGLGVPPPIPDWGRMIFNGQQFLTTQWQLATFPGLAVVVTGIGLALLGDGLSDLLRPE
jgi:peptide/nickel transport system permease protein